MVDDEDGDGLPSPEPRTDSRLALPRGFRAWQRLRIVKHDDFFSLIFPQNSIYGVGVGVGEATGGPRGMGRARTLVERWWAPWPSSFAGIFHIF